MREFSQYASAEEFINDLIADGIFPRNRKVRAAFPGLVSAPKPKHAERLKTAIVAAIIEASQSLKPSMSRARLYRAVRGDNYPAEFNQALDQLILERKISAEVLQTKGRPFTHYHLFEF